MDFDLQPNFLNELSHGSAPSVSAIGKCGFDLRLVWSLFASRSRSLSPKSSELKRFRLILAGTWVMPSSKNYNSGILLAKAAEQKDYAGLTMWRSEKRHSAVSLCYEREVQSHLGADYLLNQLYRRLHALRLSAE